MKIYILVFLIVLTLLSVAGMVASVSNEKDEVKQFGKALGHLFFIAAGILAIVFQCYSL